MPPKFIDVAVVAGNESATVPPRPVAVIALPMLSVFEVELAAVSTAELVPIKILPEPVVSVEEPTPFPMSVLLEAALVSIDPAPEPYTELLLPVRLIRKPLRQPERLSPLSRQMKSHQSGQS